MATHKVEKSRSNLEIIYEIHDGALRDDHSDCTVVDYDIWFLRNPTLPPARRDFTMSEAFEFNEISDEQPTEAERVNQSFQKMKVLPVFGAVALLTAVAALFVGTRIG